jgi:hypothetical protein
MVYMLFLRLCLFKVKLARGRMGKASMLISRERGIFGAFCKLFKRRCAENNGLLWRKEKSRNV